MTKAKKLLERFLQKPKDFSYSELVRLLNHFGYEEVTKGRISGSRVAFIEKKSGHSILLHKPHGKTTLRRYQINLIIDELNRKGKIK